MSKSWFPDRLQDGMVRTWSGQKLTAEQVEQILLGKKNDTATAAVFGVSQSMITSIRAGKTWKHVYRRVILGEKLTELPPETRRARPFHDCYTPDPNSGCWIWHGSWNKGGYGVSFPNRVAHREAYTSFKGPIPKGMCVCHKCDVPACVNPDHLFLGTSRENTQDAMFKGRMAKGNRSPIARLREADIPAIRADTRSYSAIAREYGVTPRTIILVKRGETWRHVA